MGDLVAYYDTLIPFRVVGDSRAVYSPESNREIPFGEYTRDSPEFHADFTAVAPARRTISLVRPRPMVVGLPPLPRTLPPVVPPPQSSGRPSSRNREDLAPISGRPAAGVCPHSSTVDSRNKSPSDSARSDRARSKPRRHRAEPSDRGFLRGSLRTHSVGLSMRLGHARNHHLRHPGEIRNPPDQPHGPRPPSNPETDPDS